LAWTGVIRIRNRHQRVHRLSPFSQSRLHRLRPLRLFVGQIVSLAQVVAEIVQFLPAILVELDKLEISPTNNLPSVTGEI
jgi:hypothetical protein